MEALAIRMAHGITVHVRRIVTEVTAPVVSLRGLLQLHIVKKIKTIKVIDFLFKFKS